MIFNSKLTRSAKKIGLVSAMALSMAWSTHADDKTLRFNLKSMPLNQALVQFSVQSEWQFLSAQDLLTGKTANAISGTMSRAEALKRLLEGTGLDYAVDDKGQVRIAPAKNRDRHSSRKNSGPIQLANASTDKPNRLSQAIPSEGAAVDEVNQDGIRDQKTKAGFGKLTETELEEIVVTGSHIKGAKSASPVFIFGRTDIEQTGLSTLPDFLRTLPQVFGGGPSETTAGLTISNNAGRNLSNGTGINLRGLGTESTLVLLDGRRLAPTGLGDFVDTSLFPLTAIERVEVLTDGASALYGSDAVGGVVNFVLRKDYSGAETRIRYGTVTDGSTDELQVGQVFGETWDRGHALIAYEYHQRDFLDSEERAFTKDSRDPTYLLPEQKRHSAFFTGGYGLSDDVQLFGTAFFSERKGNRFASIDTSPVSSIVDSSDSSSTQYGSNIGLEFEIGRAWQADVAGTYNKSETSNQFELFQFPFDPSSSPIVSNTLRQSSQIWSVDAKATGTLFNVPGGEIKLALGAHFRREDFNSSTNNTTQADLDRDIFAAFGELNIPLVGEPNRMDGIEFLEITLAGRIENYSDFGTSIDPKIGLVWSPFSGVQARGTYSTSFRAPLLENLSEHNVSGFLFNLPDPSSPTGITLTTLAGGNNAGLEEERATTWTVGFDIQPESIPGLDLGFTYFNIDYKNRISAGNAFFDAFLNPDFEPLIERNPDLDFIAFLFENPLSFNGTTSDPSETEALVDNRLLNLARVSTSGIDITASYSVDTDVGIFNLNLNSTYLINRENQPFASIPAVDVVDSVGNPSDFKIRGGLSWAYERFSSSLFINYVDGYNDNRTESSVDIDSWTTLDFQLLYKIGGDDGSGWLDDMDLSISVQNLFDQDPPFVLNVDNRNFDPNNASALGRFVAFQVVKRW